MVSLIKNQILKHLSRFTKNLSPDKINLSTLRGEGEMSNLELDETVLTELLELPTWLKLTKAVCNRVSVKIQWTKLKSQPIWLLLDEVLLEVETCDEPRPHNNEPSEQSSYRSAGKYGFSDKVIDGISVAINSVNVNFRSKTFSASLQLSRVQVYSVNPNWQKATDLRVTRIKDMDRGEILLFKEVDWQTTRIEANGVYLSDPAMASTPLRLIANQSKIRITLKKKLSDCSIVSSRVMFLLDDLLWVLTDTQLKAAILYTNSLKEAIEKSSQQSKKMAAEKLKRQGHMGPTADQLRHQLKQQQSRPTTASAKFFAKYDVITTSYHLITSRIDLHLCDDVLPNTDGPGEKRAVEGGAMQITLQKLSVDYYPYHPAGGERKSWYRYTDNLGSRNHWVQQLFSVFKEDVKTSKETAASSIHHDHQESLSSHSSPYRESHHASDQVHYSKADGHTHLAPPAGHGHRHGESRGHRSEVGSHRSDGGQGHSGGHQSHSGGQGHTSQPSRGNPRQTKLLESCFVLKMEEFTIFRVSTPNNRKGSVKKFLCSDKKQLHLPPDMSVIQLEFTEYYFTEGIDYPVPHANLYILVNPIRLTVDYTTILWANYFILNLAQGVKLEDLEFHGPTGHIDIKLEAVMPRVVVPSENRVPGQVDRPNAIQVQISRLTATNSRVENKSSRTDLQKLLTTYNNASLFSTTDFPNDQNPFVSIPQQFCDHASNQDNPYIDRATKGLLQGDLREANPQLHIGTLCQDAAFDIWSVNMDQIWVEFTGVPSCMGRPAPCLESIPLTIWLCNPLAMRQSGEGQSEQKNNVDMSIASEANDELLFGSPHRDKDHHGLMEKDKSRHSKKLLRQHYTVCDDTGNMSDSVDHANPLCGSHSNISQPHNHHSNPVNDVSIDPSLSSPNTQSPQLADIYLLVSFGGKLRAEINHYQYLFLMRILDSYSEFQTQLNEDMECLTPGSSASTGKLCAAMVIQELEFALVCPAIPQPSVTPSSQTFSSPLTMMPEFARLGESMDSRTDVELHVPSRDMIHDSGSGGSVNLLGSSPSRGTSIFVPKPPGGARALQQGAMTHGRGSSDPTFDRKDSLTNSPPSAETNGAHNIPSNDSLNRGARPPLNRTSSAAEVKKSLTSAWTAFSDKLKSRGDISDDSSSLYSEEYDSMSINTDMSSDDEFEFLGLDDSNEAPAFEHHSNLGLPPEAPSTTETLETPDEMPMVAVSRELLLAEKTKDHVSVIVFKLSSPELLVQTIGPDLTVRVQIKHLAVHESGNTIYEDFYHRFSSAKGYIPVSDDIESHPPMQLKYLIGSGVDPLGMPLGEVGFLDVRCQGLKLGLSMSSLTHMMDLIEDEIIPKPMPMSIQLADLGLHLKEDRPPTNFTSPGSVPLDVHISQMTIVRSEDGVFHIKGEPMEGLPHVGGDLKVPVNSQDKLSAVHQIPDVCLNERPSSRALSPREMHMSELDLSNMKVEVGRLTQQNIHLNQQLSENMSQMDLNRIELEETKAENAELRKQLQKIANFQQDESDRLLHGGSSGFDHSKGSNSYSDQSQGGNSDLSTQLSPLEQENNDLIERISFLEDELQSSTKEKDSLVATLRLLQEELLSSETRRNTRQKSPRR